MLTNTGQTAAIGALSLTHLGLADGYPGNTGTANEVSSTGYSRLSATGSTSGGAVTLTPTSGEFTATGDVYWIVAWTGSGTATGSEARAFGPMNGNAKPYCVTASDDTFLIDSHGYSDDDQVVLYRVAPAGTTAGTIYYVRSSTSDTFQLGTSTAATSAIDITATPTGYNAVVSKITPDLATATTARTVTVTTFTISIL